MPGKFGVRATQIAAITTIAIVLTISYAFLVGAGSILPGHDAQGVIGNSTSRQGLITAITSTVTTVSLETSTITYTYTSSNALTSTVVVQTSTVTYTIQTTPSCTSPGRCINLIASSSKNITRGGWVNFTAYDTIPQESGDAFTAFMDCGCSGGVAHGYFDNGFATFAVRFTVSGVHQIYVADGDQQTNSSTLVYSNSIAVNVGS
jgi:hypothetical protein